MSDKKTGLTASELSMISEMAASIHYGTLTLVFQDGVLVQVDKNEKIRTDRLKTHTT